MGDRIHLGLPRCAVAACDRHVDTAGYCRAHYSRLQKKGDVLADVPIVRRDKNRGCAVDGCKRPHKGHGLCRVHLMRLKNHGDVQAALPIVEKGASDWLKAHVAFVGDECLTWPFARNQNGAGSVTRTVVGGSRGNMSASRAMCILAHGPPPAGRSMAAHNCGKGHEACVNPRHLRWATQLENAADTLIHGTRRTLGHNGRRALTQMQIKAVRFLAPHMTEPDLAIIFGVPLDAIGRALGRASAAKVRL